MIDARTYVTNPGGRYKVPWSDVVGIAVHHSVSGGQFFTGVVMFPADELNHIRTIDSYHVSLGYGGFGYHLAAFPSGRLYLCGDLDGARAHVASRNAELRGIVLIGDFTARDPGAWQVSAGAEGVAQVRAAASAPLPVAGHRTWALPEYPTSCPGDRLNARLSELEHYQEDSDMPDPVFREPDGTQAQVGLLGKHSIGNAAHAEGLIAGGAKLVDVPAGTLAGIPDPDEIMARAIRRVIRTEPAWWRRERARSSGSVRVRLPGRL